MYVLVKDGKIVKFPYSATDLIHDNKNTSFPRGILSDELLSSWGVLKVVESPVPDYDATTHKYIQKEPIFENGLWFQQWELVPLTEEEMQSRKVDNSEIRLQMYRNVSDPLFFKVQAGEATMEEWLASRDKIKTTYPDIES